MSDTLALKIDKIGKFFNIDSVVNINAHDNNVAKYYKVNKVAYSLFHNKHNFVHMGLSKGGQYKEKDLYEQPNFVGSYIKALHITDVLELGVGKGANSLYLAKEFPSVSFVGLDLPEGQTDVAIKNSKMLSNLKIVEGDYHDLSDFPNKSFGVVFVIEALCHSSHKDVVAREVNRILKEGGLFIVIDGYLGKAITNFNKNELLAKKLVEKGMLVNSFEEYNDVKAKIIREGFGIEKDENVSEQILPTLYRFEKLAKLIFSLGLFGKLLIKVFPSEFSNNGISGYLMPDLIKSGVAKYYISVFRKL